MNPAANAATSAGVAGAAVTLAIAVLDHFHVTVTAACADALGTLATAAIGYFLHRQSIKGAAPQVESPK